MIILVDALRKDHLGCYGYFRNTSPNLNSLAAEGTLFCNATSQASETLGSISSLFTGRYPTEHGSLWAQADDKTFLGPRLQLPTIADVLKARGYVTAAISASPIVGFVMNFNKGFDYFDQTLGLSGWQDFSAADLYQKVIGWLSQYKSEQGNFFLYLHFIDPHNLYRPPKEFIKYGEPKADPRDLEINMQMNALATKQGCVGITDMLLTEYGLSRKDTDRLSDLYDGEILCADHYIVAFLQQLKIRGLYNNTIIIVTADHGECFLEHGNLKHGGSLYQELINVPLIIRIPGVRGNKTNMQIVELVDILPTLCEVLNLKPHIKLSGSSFYKLFKNDKFVSDKLGLSQSLSAKLYTLRRGSMKLILGPNLLELYDLEKDPHEITNLKNENPAVLKKLLKILNNMLKKYRSTGKGTKVATKSELEMLRSLGYIK